MKKVIIPLVVFIMLFAVALPADAQIPQIWEGVDCNEQGKGPCTVCDGLKVTANVVDFLVGFAIGLSALMVAYGAILIMVSGANEGMYSKGKKTITWALIGVAVALGGWILVNTVINILAPNTDFLPWSEIECVTPT